MPIVGALLDVRRTRALIRFSEPVKCSCDLGAVGLGCECRSASRTCSASRVIGSVALTYLLLPGSVEPDPRQLVLVADVESAQ